MNTALPAEEIVAIANKYLPACYITSSVAAISEALSRACSVPEGETHLHDTETERVRLFNDCKTLFLRNADLEAKVLIHEEIRLALKKCVIQLYHIKSGYFLGGKIEEALKEAEAALATSGTLSSRILKEK